jgi:hypothetical protein
MESPAKMKIPARPVTIAYWVFVARAKNPLVMTKMTALRIVVRLSKAVATIGSQACPARMATSARTTTAAMRKAFVYLESNSIAMTKSPVRRKHAIAN